jgi:hypothetical protein
METLAKLFKLHFLPRLVLHMLDEKPLYVLRVHSSQQIRPKPVEAAEPIALDRDRDGKTDHSYQEYEA